MVKGVSGAGVSGAGISIVRRQDGCRCQHGEKGVAVQATERWNLSWLCGQGVQLQAGKPAKQHVAATEQRCHAPPVAVPARTRQALHQVGAAAAQQLVVHGQAGCKGGHAPLLGLPDAQQAWAGRRAGWGGE